MTKSAWARLCAPVLGVLLLAGCGGGGGGGTPSTGTLTGVFVDATTSGLNFTVGTQSGVTGPNGSFTYTPGATITFSIGGITLGSALAQAVITPVQLVPGAINQTNNIVTNIARFLQTLDNNNLADGIQISIPVANLARGMTINFNQTPAAFGANLNVLSVVATLTAATSTGQIPLVTAAAAQSHLANSLISRRAGTYTGTFSGMDSGTWTATVSALGTIVGSATSSASGAFSLSGQVTSSGSATLAQGGIIGGGASFVTTSWGLNGIMSGNWSDASTGNSGTFNGSASFIPPTFTGSVTHTVGGTVGGLTGSVTLQNNAGDALTVTANGGFTFATGIAKGAAYAVTVSAQPAGQTCAVASGSGTVATANVTGVVVTCTAIVPTHNIAGTITGLIGTVALQNNGGNTQFATSNGTLTAFAFTTAIAEGATYAVTVSAQPTGQTCTVSNGSGTVAAANVINVAVTCTANSVPTHTIGGAVNGLTGT